VPSSSTAAVKEYRRDIDGLRAIAVLAVVGFHAEVALFRGGFVGVDVFFVISGYLISGIILRALARDSFSFADFYRHRINRIFPALALVLAATLVFGSIVLFPPEFVALGKHVAGGAGFLSNIFLWNETGYFDSQNKLLLHLWSLGVEEQFYLLWPLVLFAAWKKKWSIAGIIAVIAVASFANNVWMVMRSDRSMAFYFPNTRLWELLAGALLAQFEISHPASKVSSWLSQICGFAGIAALIVSVLFIRADMAWPGWLAAIPVAGTVLIIGAGKGSIVNRFIGNRVLVGIGLISYPLYLWHWPLLVFGRLINEGQVPREARIVLVVIAFALAWATYEFVEKPIRFGARRKEAAKTLIPVMGVVACIGVFAYSGTMRPRLTRVYDSVIFDKTQAPRGAYFNRSRKGVIAPTLRGDSTNVVALLGDSHMVQYWPRFELLAQSHPMPRPEVMLLGYGGCPPLPGVNRKGLSWDGQPFNCALFHRLSLAKLQDRSTTTVVYSACWECYFKELPVYLDGTGSRLPIRKSGPAFESVFAGLTSEITRLVKLGKRVYIILPNPNSKLNNPSGMLPRRLPGLSPKAYVRSVSRASIDSLSGFVRRRLEKVARTSGARTIDPVAATCSLTACPTVTSENHPIYTDNHHFTPQFVRDRVLFLDTLFQSR
jgi:peptidoglycan/LPS O-acetylase OafA/YrhL